MYKFASFILLMLCWLCLICGHMYAQQVKWVAGRPLLWEDFKGKKPRRSRWTAVTYSYLRYTLNYNIADSADVKVMAMFNSNLSWKRYKKPKAHLLKHEQIHFDIAELYARKIRQSFAKYKFPENPVYHDEACFKEMYEQKISEMNRCQNKYDRQTKHSRRKAMQACWNVKISNGLDELKVFEER